MSKRPRRNKVEDAMVRSLDELAEFQKFQTAILPVLRQAITEQWSAEKIWSNPVTQALLAAQAVTIGLSNADQGKALSAIMSVMDRTIGRPKEKAEVTHKIEKLKDSELDALLATHIADMDLNDDKKLN